MSKPSNISDGATHELDLILRVQRSDDRHAFATLVRHHQSSVRGLLRRLVGGDEALADDLAQETFIRVYRGLKGFRTDARFSTWVYRVAYNVFLTHHARQERRADADAQTPTADTSTRDLDRQVMLQRDLQAALTLLSPPQRTAITLAYKQGLSHAEVAEVLDCPVGTVKTHILRGKQTLKDAMSAWAPPEVPKP